MLSHRYQGLHEPPRLAVLTGSLRPGRFGPVVGDWFVQQARAFSGFDVGAVDLGDVVGEGPWHDPGDDPQWRDTVARADAFVVITPEYNHSYPGALKHAIDSLNGEWHRKTVGFVSYGGLSGGRRAVEALRLVFAELYMVSVRETVSFHGGRACFDDSGTPNDREVAETAARRMLGELGWWARALRSARAEGLPLAS